MVEFNWKTLEIVTKFCSKFEYLKCTEHIHAYKIDQPGFKPLFCTKPNGLFKNKPPNSCKTQLL